MTDKLTQQEATAKIAEHVAAAYEAIRQAESIADEYGLSFSFDLTYGAGAQYIGDMKDRWNDTGSGWHASSQQGC